MTEPPPDPYAAGYPPPPPPPGYGPPPPGYGPPPPGYGAPPPGYGYGYARPTESKATSALVCAILSFVFCPVVLAVVALVLAGQAEQAIAASNGWLAGADQVKWARILSWVHLALAAVGIVLFFLFFAAVFTTGHVTRECLPGPCR